MERTTKSTVLSSVRNITNRVYVYSGSVSRLTCIPATSTSTYGINALKESNPNGLARIGRRAKQLSYLGAGGFRNPVIPSNNWHLAALS